MVPLHLRVSQFASRHELWSPGARVVAALSGGSDSVALLLLLAELARRGDLVLAGAAHLHHGLRGTDADEDARFCADVAAGLDLPFELGHADVPDLAGQRHVSHEVAGREARKAFLAAAAGRLRADRIATAHTRDDQAETVLLRACRGAGLRGLSGILPANGAFVRPLLECSRAELVQWLTSRGQGWREDVTNAEFGTPRNRLRHIVLPELRAHLNPSVDRALARLAESVRVDEHYLAAAAMAASESLFHHSPRGLELPIEGLRALPAAIARRVARLALETVGGGRTYGMDEANRLLRFTGDAERTIETFEALSMERIGPAVVLSRRRLPRSAPPVYRYPLTVPGSCPVPEAGIVIEATGPMPASGVSVQRGPDEAVLAADAALSELVVRNWEPGDSMRPLGLSGRKKLQDLFVDRKVPREERGRVAVVVDRLGRIAWVAGHAVSEEFRVTVGTSGVIVLKLRRK